MGWRSETYDWSIRLAAGPTMRCLKRHRALARFAKSRRFQTAAQHSVKIFHPDPHPDPNGTKLRPIMDESALSIRWLQPFPGICRFRPRKPLTSERGRADRGLGGHSRITEPPRRANTSQTLLNLVPFHPDPYFSRSVFDKYDILSYCV